MKSQGYCTRNENNLFEVNWETDETFFTKLFKKKTKFSFTCNLLHECNYIHYVEARAISSLPWKNEYDVLVTDEKVLQKIQDVFIREYFLKVSTIFEWNK